MGISDFMKKMMFVRQFNSENGAISVYELRLVTMAFVSLREIQKEMLEELGGRGVQIIYTSSKKGGYELAKQLSSVMGVSGSKAIDLLVIGCRDLTGWGNFKLVDYKSDEKKAIFQVTNGPFAETKAKAESCHFTRGLIAGAMEQILGGEIDAVETKCASKGDAYCEFVVQPSKNFDTKSQRVKEQLKK